jgi:competence protein ComEC
MDDRTPQSDQSPQASAGQPPSSRPLANREPAQRAPTAAYDPLAIVLLAACGGILVDRWASLTWVPWVSAAVVGLLAWYGLWRARRDRLAAIVLLGAVAATAGGWHHLCWNLFDRDDLGLFAREAPYPAALEAIALSSPAPIPAPPFDPLRAIPQGDRGRLTIKLVAIRDGAAWRPAAGRCLLLVEGHLLGVRAGDRLRVFGQLSRPRRPDNPGAFDYASYTRGMRQLSVARADFPDCVAVLARGAWWSPRRWINDLLRGADARLWRALDHDRSGLAASLLLGQRDELDDERSDAFLRTGTVHILAISGMHIAILAGALFYALRLGLLPPRAALAAVAALITLYTVLTGMQPSAVRATALVLALCLGRGMRRPLSTVNSLSFAALVVLAINPTDLFSVGAQLSFLAVATLAWFARWMPTRRELDPLERLIASARSWPDRGARWAGSWVARITLAGLAVWLVTSPLVMARFHLISPAAVVLTTLSWLPVTIALLSGFSVLTIGWLLPPLGSLLASICDASLSMLDWLVTRGAAVPGSHFWVPGPDDWWLVGLYGGLGLWWAAPRWRPPRRWGVALAAAWIGAGFAAPWVKAATRPADRLECVFLSVGHGNAVVLRLPDGRTMLCDAGSLGSPRGAAQTVSACLWSRGVTHLDAVVITHADVDHYNAVPELLERFSVGVVYVSPVMFETPTAALDRLRESIERAGVPLRELHGGQRLRVDGGSLAALHPPQRGVLGSDNANSIVLQVEAHGQRVLLTGDLETPGLEALLAEAPRDCQVLMAPHHGSRLSDPPGMSAWCRPRHVVVSGGHGDISPEVETAYRGAGAKLWNTARHGAVWCEATARGIQMDGWKEAD